MKPLLGVIGLVGVALLVVAVLDRWRVGSILLGLSFCLAAGLRVVLPAERVGDLAVRSRAVDTSVLLALGFGLVALANTIPPGR